MATTLDDVTSLQLREILIAETTASAVTSGSFDTPMCHNSRGSEDGYDKLKDLELAAKNELAGHMYQDESQAESFGKNAFIGKVAPDKDIEEFILNLTCTTVTRADGETFQRNPFMNPICTTHW